MKRLAMAALVVASCVTFAFANGAAEGGSDLPVMEGYQSATAAGVNVQWRVEGDSLSVQMAAATTGWVAVGFDPSRRMADANFIIGYVANGTLEISDDYGVASTRHEPDTRNGGSSDISEASGEESADGTVIRFVIPLDSGDDLDRPLRVGESYKVIVAHGPDGADDFTTYHAERGSFTMDL